MDNEFLFGDNDPCREIRELEWEHPSSDFTRRVMDKLPVGVPVTVHYRPLIPTWGWCLLFTGAALIVAAVMKGIISLETNTYGYDFREALDSVSLTSAIRSLDLSSPFVYGALALVAFLYLHIFLYRFYGLSPGREL